MIFLQNKWKKGESDCIIFKEISFLGEKNTLKGFLFKVWSQDGGEEDNGGKDLMRMRESRGIFLNLPVPLRKISVDGDTRGNYQSWLKNKQCR